ncbi:MAG: TIGR01212 family radical SAM protein [Blautia sp.]|nr:TIGR01212 family radical SAM protein [Blautia sp.]
MSGRHEENLPKPSADERTPIARHSDEAAPDWHGKLYYSLDAWCKNTLRRKCYKVALNAHMTCPNRDGSKGTRGCVFCSAGGSGEFAVSAMGRSVAEQLAEGEALLARKVTLSQDHPCIIAYFQAYTNTYAPVEYLERIFSQTLSSPRVCGISIATRPDCLPEEVLALLSALKDRFPDKFIWIELGLQTIHETTARLIRRGYDLACFEDAFQRLRELEIPVILHTILFLPGESRAQMLETVSYVDRLRPFGIKLQLLHVLKGADLAEHYARKEFQVPDREEYLDMVVDCLEGLSPEIVVHRVTGDGPKNILIAPLWSADKRSVLNGLHRKLKERGSLQGCRKTQSRNENTRRDFQT